MSINYYMRPEGACETQCSNWVHLGQYSMGWRFLFQATTTVKTFKDWLSQLDRGEIYDEYDRPVEAEDLIERVREAQAARSRLDAIGIYADGEGYEFMFGGFS